jgi:hypothetical protein
MKALLAAALLTAPRAASACAVCFGGDGKSPGLFDGFWWAIVVLLGVTMSLVAAIGWTLWTVERRRAEKDA